MTAAPPALRDRLAHAAGVGLLILATYLAFAPSMGHVPRWDHWWFLHDASRHESFGELVRRYHSYNRSRVHGRGDFGLYRPVLFALLCAEQAAFGTDFAAWQRTGLILHIGFVLLLLSLLLRARRMAGLSPGTFCPLAYALCLLFAVNLSVCEMVYWCHINGYILFTGLCLAAVRVASGWLTRGRGAIWRLTLVWSLVALAAFTHEAGQFFAVVFGTMLALATWPTLGLLRASALGLAFLAVLPLYQTINAYDYALRMGEHRLFETPGRMLIMAWEKLGTTLFNVWRYVLFTVVQPFFPSCVQWSSFGRVVLTEPAQNPGPYLVPGPLALVSYATLGLLLAGAMRGVGALDRSFTRRWLPWLMLPVALASIQIGMNVLGRLNLRPGPGVLISSSYYAYLPLACLLIVVYGAWQLARSRGWAGPRMEIVTVVGLILVAAFSARQTYQIGVALKNDARLVRYYTRDLRALLQPHRTDPNFRFTYSPELTRSLPRFGRDFQLPFPEILFPRLVNHERPTHVLTLQGNDLALVPVAEFRRLAQAAP